MKFARLIPLFIAAIVLQIGVYVSVSKTLEPQDRLRQIPGRAAGHVRSRALDQLPSRLRPDAEALLSATDERQKRSLIERLSDSALDAVTDLFVDVLIREPAAAVRMDLLEYLTRNPRPNLAPVFEHLAKNDPDPGVAVAALEGVRAVEVLKVREILTNRLAQSRGDRTAFATFSEADERWISLVRGSMLPAFLRVPPQVFSVKDQNSIRVVALGDFGTGTAEQQQVAATMLAQHRQRPFDIGITVGDNFYPVGMESPQDPRWKTWWDQLYSPLSIGFYPTLGNHDWYDFDSPAAEILYSGYSSSWHMPSPYYTFIAGPVQFFALDTQEVSQKQLTWLDEQLGKSTARWKVAYGHHPIFSDGYHGDNPRLQEQLFPLLKNRVDIYLAGHEHDLQHLKPQGGVHFLVSGGGGRSLRSPQPSDRALLAVEQHGFTILEANAGQFDIRFVGSDGQTIHQYTLRK